MRASKKTGVALVFVAATLMATNVAATDDGDTGGVQPEGAAMVAQAAEGDFESQADFIGVKMITLTGPDFRPVNETDSWHIENTGARCIQGNFVSLYADLELPHGSTVTGLTLHGNDTDGSNSISARLREIDFVNDTVTDLFNANSGDPATDGRSSWSGVDQGQDTTLNKNSEDFVVYAYTDLEADSTEICGVQIFYTPPTSGGMEFHAITPCAIFDTRSGSGDFNGKLTPGETVTVDAILSDYSTQGGNGSSCGVPSAGGLFFDPETTTRAIAINLVAIGAEGPGNLKAWANGASEPNGGVVNYGDSQTNSNEFSLNVQGSLSCGLGCFTNGGLFKVKNNGAANTHVRGVVVGYYTPVDSNQ